MNTIDILAPRWRDRKILLAEWKLGVMNKVVVHNRSFPEPLYISGRKAMQYPVELHPTKNGGTFRVRAIPISDFKTEPAMAEA